MLTNGAPGQWNTGPGGIDGDFGPHTQASVEAFQRWGHVGADGIVGDQTWAVSLHAMSATLENAGRAGPCDRLRATLQSSGRGRAFVRPRPANLGLDGSPRLGAGLRPSTPAPSRRTRCTYASTASCVCITERVHSSSRPGVMKIPRFMLYSHASSVTSTSWLALNVS